MRTTLALGLGLSLIVLACGQRSPLGTPRVVRCGAHSVFQTNAARIAVSPLDGDRDGAATELLMSAILRLDEEMTSDRTHRMFEVVRLKRGVASHDAARTCAENLGADVVVWGTLVENQQSRAAVPSQVTIRVDKITAGDNATINIGNIDLGGKPFSLLPRVTLRRKQQWLTTSSRLDVFSLADVDFDVMASDQSLFFVPFLGGVAALDRGDNQQAMSMFDVATRGSLKAKGVPRVYALTYFGAIQLSFGHPSVAVERLAQTSEHLGGAPDSLVWQNRFLYGLANDETGNLVVASTAYAEAAARAAKLDGDLRDRALMARATVELHRGNVAEALTAFSGMKSRRSTCSEWTTECVTARAAPINDLSLRFLMLQYAGYRAESGACLGHIRDEFDQLISWAKGFDGAKDELHEHAWDRLSADTPPSLQRVAMSQNVGCSGVHAPAAVAAAFAGGRASDSALAAADVLQDFESISEGRGTLGRNVQDAPPRERDKLLLNWACQFSIVASEMGAGAEAVMLAKKAEALLSAEDGPLLAAEVRLLQALPSVRSSSRSEVTEEAASIIRDVLPTLGKTMGADSPLLRAWEEASRSGHLADPEPVGPVPIACEPLPD